MSELYSCPFDGAPAKIERIPENWGVYPEAIYAKCTKCGVSSPAEYVTEWVQGKGHLCRRAVAQTAVLSWWNRRP